VRRFLVVGIVAGLIVAGAVVSLAMVASLAWDEVPPPPEPAAGGTAADTHSAHTDSRRFDLLSVATTLEGRAI
jgi:hypothetical protein